jgi:hypothetical protein
MDGTGWLMIHRRNTRWAVLIIGCLAAIAAALGPVAPALADQHPRLTLLSPPTISGTAQIGQTLTESHARWNVDPFGFAYQWQDCDSSGQNCQAIAGASKSSYVVAASDAGHTLRIEETAYTWLGRGQAFSAVTVVVPSPLGSNPPVPIRSDPTTTSLSPLESSAVTDQTVTLIATVTSSSSAVAPSGMLTFENVGTPIGGCQNEPLRPTGQSVTMTCQTSFAASTAQLTAAFTPAAGSLAGASVSTPVSFAVQPAPTTTSVGTSSHTVHTGSSATYTATVQPSYLGPLAPSQAVVFLDNGMPIPACASQPLAWSGGAAVASCRVTYTQPGQHLISATYGGDGNFAASSSAGVLVDAVAGRIHPSLSWTFYYTPGYTEVLGLTVGHVLRGARVRVTCTGRGCPARPRAVAVRHSRLTSGGVSLVALFRGRRLRPGTVIAVTIRRRGWIGKRYVFKIRSGRAPRLTMTCQAPGLAPGVGC